MLQNPQHTIYSQEAFFPENRVVYEIMRKNIVETDRPQMAIWRMCIACWVTQAIDDSMTRTLCLLGI